MASRREFLKTSGVVCIAACGTGLLISALQACKTSSSVMHVAINKNEISVPVESFAIKKVVIVRNINLADDIAIIKKSDSEYSAILMECTHQQNAVEFNGSGFYCPLHGSTFDIDGNVLKEPAITSLKKYPVRLQEGQVIIKIA